MTKSKDIVMDAMTDKELKRSTFKMINSLKKDSNKQINEAMMSIQDFDNNFNNVEEKFNRDRYSEMQTSKFRNEKFNKSNKKLN
jgi:hypothetical protein